MAGKKHPVPSSDSVQPSTGAQAKVAAKDILVAAGLADSHWGRRIIYAEKDGFNGRDVLDAGKWTDCACGKQDPRIPRDEDGAPLDGKLNILGQDFLDAVEGEDYIGAANTLVAIQVRASELLMNLAVTVADVPGLSTADQADVAVTSHQEGVAR